jgi:hypothetical protein
VLGMCGLGFDGRDLHCSARNTNYHRVQVSPDCLKGILVSVLRHMLSSVPPGGERLEEFIRFVSFFYIPVTFSARIKSREACVSTHTISFVIFHMLLR